MDIIALLCVLFILLNIQYPKRGSIFHDDALQKNRTNALKGFAAILIVLGHLGLTVQSGASLPILKQTGMFVVTIFFALSGYGLVLSYKASSCKLMGYWKKRLLTVILPYAIFTVIYILVRMYLGESISAKSVAMSFVNGTPLVRYSWFVEVIIVCYAAFWVLAKLAKDDVSFMCFGMTVFTVIFCLGMKKLGFESFWYNTVISFTIGMLWANNRRDFAEKLKKHLIAYLLGTLLIFACIVYCTRVLWWWGDLGEMLVTSVFVIFVLMLQYLVPARSNAVTRFIGDISFEMYMSHGAFIMLLWPLPFFKANPLIFGIAVYVGSILTAWLMHMLIGAIKKTLLKK